MISIVSIQHRPDLVPVVARWLWDAFWRSGGHTLEQTRDAVSAAVTAQSIPRTLVLLEDGTPIGTAGLVAHDLEERPDLSPWLAAVFVEPAARGQGYASRLVWAVEQETRGMSIGTLWLYTDTAERLYARAGWRTVETVQHNGKVFALMRRELVA